MLNLFTTMLALGAANKPCTAAELCFSRSDLDPHSTLDSLSYLWNKGYVQFEQSGPDKKWYLTELGLEYADKVRVLDDECREEEQDE